MSTAGGFPDQLSSGLTDLNPEPNLSAKPSLTAAGPPLSIKPYLLIGAISAAMGILANILFWRSGGLGLNLFLWTLCGSAAAVAVLRAVRGTLSPRSLILLGGSLLFSALYVWRGSEGLAFLNLLVSGLLAGLALSPSFSSAPLALGSAAVALKQSLMNLISGPFRFMAEFPWRSVTGRLTFGTFKTAIRGIMLALPLILIFGMLFRSADPRFESLLTTIGVMLFDSLATRLLLFLGGVAVSAGLLRMACLGIAADFSGKSSEKYSLHATEGTVCLGLLNVLFALFVVLQTPYLFGGITLVATSPDLTLAQYARRGFFELATVAALVLPLLLGADWLLAQDTSLRQRQVFRGACAVLLLLLAVIMASALQRMCVYMQEFGLTRLRLFISAFILMLGAVFVWFGATVLRGRRDLFLGGALIIGCGSAVALQAANPDAQVARYNLQRCRTGQPCDVEYLARLSADAVPTIVQELQKPGIPNAEKFRELLRKHHRPEATRTWQSWNFSRAQATAALEPLNLWK